MNSILIRVFLKRSDPESLANTNDIQEKHIRF